MTRQYCFLWQLRGGYCVTVDVNTQNMTWPGKLCRPVGELLTLGLYGTQFCSVLLQNNLCSEKSIRRSIRPLIKQGICYTLEVERTQRDVDTGGTGSNPGAGSNGGVGGEEINRQIGAHRKKRLWSLLSRLLNTFLCPRSLCKHKSLGAL